MPVIVVDDKEGGEKWMEKKLKRHNRMSEAEKDSESDNGGEV